MADLGKLWFELGLRENVTGELDRIKKEMLAIQQAALLTSIALRDMNDANDKAARGSAKSAEKQEASMKKVETEILNIQRNMKKLDGLMNTNKMGANVDAVKNAYNELNNILSKYQEAQAKGNISTADLKQLNGELAVARAKAALATQQFTNDTRAAAASERDSAKATRDSNKSLNDAQRILSQNSRTVREYANTFDKLGESMKGTNRIASELGNQINSYLSIYAAERFIKSMITIGGEFEKQHIALKSMLGDAQQANEIFSQIKSLAPISPFTFRDLTTYAKQLTAFNVPFEELYDTTKRLSDISAGLGVDMSRLILAYGQVRSASVLRGQELRQFTEAGIPIVQALSDKLTEMNGKLVTTGEVFDYISKRKVPFEMVKEILWDLTEEGGRFFNMQMVLSDTLAGKWANLQDSWEIMLSTMANSQSAMGATMKFGVTQITNLVNSLNKLAPMLATGGILTLLGVGGGKAWNNLKRPTAALQQQILNAKRLVAHQIEMNVETGKQTALQQKILATKTAINEEDLVMLLTEGKISNLQLMQVLNARKLSVAKTEMLLAAKGYTAEQIKQITNATRLSVLTGKISGFMKTNGWMIALAAVGASIGYFWDQSSEAAQAASDAADNAAQRYGELKKVLDATNAKNPKVVSDIKTEINGIEEALKDVDPFLERFKEAHNADGVKEYYEAIRRELELTIDAYDKASKAAKANQDAIKGKKGINVFGLFTLYDPTEDSTDEDIKDWNDKAAEIKKAITNYKQGRINAIQELLKDVAKSDEEVADAIENETSIYAILNKLFGDEVDEKKAEENYNKLKVLAKQKSDSLFADIEDVYDRMNKFTFSHGGSLRSKYGEMYDEFKQTVIAAKDAVIEEGGFEQKDIDELTDSFQISFAQMLMSWTAQWKNFGDDAKEVMNKVVEELLGIQGLYSTKRNGASGGAGGAGGSGSGSGTTDLLLKQWKEEFDELKKFYAQYKKWAKAVGEDEALRKLQEDGLFAGMFEGGKPIYDIKSWEKALDQFMSKINGNTIERKKFQTSVKVEKLDFQYDEIKEDLDNLSKRISEYISDEVSKYNLFEKIFEKTGDRSFAMNAFRDGKVWDDLSRGLAQKLADMLGKSVGDIDFDADSVSMEKALESTEGAYDLWKKIVEITSNNYTKSLENAASATEKLMNYEEKIAKLRAQRAELERRGASRAELIAIDKEIMKQQTEQFENSTDYLRFYSAILSMTTDEAERIGTSIRENLVRQLADGSINADKYLKSMRNITQQIEKARGGLLGNSDFATFVNGGQKGLVDKRWEEMASAAIKVQKAEEDLMKAQERANDTEILSAEERFEKAKRELNAAKEALEITEKQYQQLSDISMIADAVMGALNGMQSVAKAVSDMFDAIGNENAANTWSDIADGIGIVTDTLKPLDGILKNFMSGNISGMVSNALLAPVNLITAPITGIAKLHDKKLDRAIQQSQFEVRKLQSAYEDLEKSISGRLGGIYGGSEYTKMLENLRMQRTELQKQMEAEDAKKKTDKQKMEDYKNSIKEMDDEIKNFAADMAKSLYDIDVKSWAKQLTDAVVSAWVKGEDAAQAFHDKVKDIIRDLSVNILTQKVMEAALQPVFDEIVAEMERKSGKLDEQSIDRFASALDARVEEAVPALTNMLEQLKAKGWDISESSSSSSSSALSKGIQGTTEETSNLLASYLNATRADVSVIRQILESVYGSANNMIAQAQLVQLEMIASSTARNADAAERIEGIFNAVTLGTKQIYIH